MKRFIAETRQIPGGFFVPGDHKVTIEAATDELSRAQKAWKDQTEQVKLTFRNEEGVLSHWYNLKGFKKLNKVENPTGAAPKGFEYRQGEDTNGNPIGEFYLVDLTTNTRVEDAEATKTARSIFCGVAGDAGIPADQDFDLVDLAGKEIGIHVRMRADNGKPEIQYTMVSDKVKVVEGSL